MNTSKRIIAIFATALALIMISSPFIAFSGSTATAVNASAVPVSVNQADGYGDLLQYEWPTSTGNPASTRFSAGPAPGSPDILWKFDPPGGGRTGTVTAFNGMVFVRRPRFWALDAFTGSVIWEADYTGTAVKLDDTRMLVGRRCVEIATGNVLWEAPSGFRGTYVPELKMAFSGTMAWDLSDLSQLPTLAWERTDFPDGGAGSIYGDGKLFGSGLGHEMALNATTGETIWDTELTGKTDYLGCYYMGRWLKASLDGRLYCLDGETGEVLWIFNPGTFWNYWTSGMAAGYGKVYMYNLDTHLYCLDVRTGKMVWKYKGPGAFYPTWPTVGGGKVYMCTGSYDYRDPATGELGTNEYACLDAETGKLIWKLPIDMNLGGGRGGTGIVAFGNMYLNPGGSSEQWCIGNRPKDWSMFRGDAAHLAEGGGPTNLALKWKYQTDGIIISSPAIVDGVVYAGSHDKNIYALDADTGSKIWSSALEYRIKSSPAVVDDKVYTGADDGNFYCLDAEDGTQLWKTPAGGIIDIGQSAQPRIRSSPTVVGGKVYVGSLDTNFYCLDANTGTTLWTFPTGGPVTSSAAVVDGAVYITSSTPRPSGTLYKLNADTGAVIWQLSIPYGRGPDMHASPTVADDMVFLPADAGAHYRINAITGAVEWTIVGNQTQRYTYLTGSILYAYGKVYMADPDQFTFSCYDATNGTKIWSIWLAREIYSSAAYAVGKVYIGMDNNAFYVLDALTGEKLSWYDGFDSNCIWSSPALYNGRVYIGSLDGNVYCFEQFSPDPPLISTEVTASLSKSQVDKDLSESVTVSGSVSPIYTSIPVKVTFVKPDGTTTDVSATTTAEGDFEASYTPNVVGSWTATAWWEGDETHNYAFTEDMPLTVVGEEEPTNGNGEEPPPEEEGIPTEYIYAAVAVIAIIIIAIAAYAYLKRGK